MIFFQQLWPNGLASSATSIFMSQRVLWVAKRNTGSWRVPRTPDQVRYSCSADRIALSLPICPAPCCCHWSPCFSHQLGRELHKGRGCTRAMGVSLIQSSAAYILFLLRCFSSRLQCWGSLNFHSTYLLVTSLHTFPWTIPPSLHYWPWI